MNQRPPLGGAPGRRGPSSDGYDRRDRLPDDFAERPRPAGRGLAADRDEPADGLGSLRSGALLRWLGTMSTLRAVIVLAAATLVGVVLTLIAHQEPGDLLAFFIVVGAVVAVLGVRRGAVYLFFPMPALAFFAAAVVTGIVHDSQLASSTAGLATSFLQWIAGIFVPAVVATVIVLLVGGGRWLLKSALVTVQPSLSSPRPASRDNASRDNVRPAPGPRRPPPGDPRLEEDIIGDDDLRPGKNGPAPRRGSAPRPSPNGTRPPRPQRTDRDPWGDPRLSADRSQPPRPRPASQPQPRSPQSQPQPRSPQSQPQPRASQPQPRAPRPQAGPSWTPKPQRPPRPQPPDGWT